MNKELQQVIIMELNFENKEDSQRIRNKVTSTSKSSKGQFQSVALTFKVLNFKSLRQKSLPMNFESSFRKVESVKFEMKARIESKKAHF